MLIGIEVASASMSTPPGINQMGLRFLLVQRSFSSMVIDKILESWDPVAGEQRPAC